MDWRDYIRSDREVLGGKPVVRGTRISAELILEKLAFQSFEEILLDYPGLTRKQLQAVLVYALDLLRMDDVVPAPAAGHS